MASVERLKERLARALKAKKIRAALEAIAALAEMEPDDPVWPERAARLLRATDDVKSRLRALRRALELQVEQSLDLDAIATCQTILEVAPGDQRSSACLARLLRNRDFAPMANEIQGGGSGRREAALDSLSLGKIVPGARSVQMGDADTGHVREIPVDGDLSSTMETIPDLRLDEWNPPADLEDLVAAQAASLPSPSDHERAQAARSQNAASLRVELANVPLFGDLDPASLHTLIRRVRVVEIKAGQALFRQGDAANSLYVIVKGAVVPIAEGDRRRKLAVLEPGEFFGEIGLLTKQPRNATIEGLVDTKILAIDRRVLWELIEKQPSVATNILRFLRARLIDRQIRTNLFFAAFAHAEREAVARQFRILEVVDGTRILEQGKPPQGLFVVLSGSLELFDRERAKQVGELGLGDVLGGLSLLDGQAAITDVVARGKCWLVVLGEARFRRIVEANPRLVRVLRRLENAEVYRRELPKVAVL